MKKIGLLTTLLVAGLLLTGCNNSSKDGANHTGGKSNSKAVQICEDNDGEVTTDELGNNICLLNALEKINTIGLFYFNIDHSEDNRI